MWSPSVSEYRRRWAARGFVKATITADGHDRYDLEKYLEEVEEAARRAK